MLWNNPLKAGDLGRPCPRCQADGAVEIYYLSSSAQRLIVMAFVAVVVAVLLDPQRRWLYHFLNACFVVLLLLWAGDAVCRKCGAHLTREIGGGWR